MLNNKTITYDIGKIDFSDSDGSDNDYSTNIDLLNKLELRYFPEPYDTIGQFILSSIVGACTSYIMNLRANKSVDYSKFINAYYKYCKTVLNDDYINEIKKNLSIDASKTEDNNKFEQILDKTSDTAKELMSKLIDINGPLFDKFKDQSNETFSVESFNSAIIKELIPLIKFEKIINLIK